MLDLTKEIKLDEKNSRRYRRLQAFFYAFCFVAATYVAYFIFFPTQEFNFSFLMLTSNKGNALNPRDVKGTLITDGKFPTGQHAYFDASLVGSFSKIKLSFTPNRQSLSPENSHIDLRKSYRAFLYPEGQPIGFKDGTLIKNQNGSYLVSDGKLRKFASSTIADALGFPKEAFLAIDSDADLKYNPSGDDITDTKNYPADSIFKINENYYLLATDGALEKFISAGAFHSQYDESLVISKTADFLNSYPVAKDPLGFADGSLVSYGSSAYIVSKNKIYPIGDPDIFVNQGYSWDDIITISGDEFSLYAKEKLFTLTSIHPDGTIFLTSDSHRWYQIENGQKHELPSQAIAQSWLKKNPISVSAKSLEILGSCDLKKEFFGNYFCLIPLDDTKDSAGKYYEFTLAPKDNLKIDNLNLLYEKNMTMQNLKLAVRSMILKIKAHYGIQSAPQQ
ncbi:MAG: hypothetical protein NTY33_00580 [Candidatus Moranbacteria bacterium]|nr:hypothetical protein [Candidatus Moranbacteria bacterium]